MSKLYMAMAVVVFLSGCASNQYSVRYASDPSGAQLYCGGVAKGYTPVTLYYTLDKETKAQGVLNTVPCGVKWASGATAEADRQIPIDKFPNGVMVTIPRPNVEGYTLDAEFALKVRMMEADERAANAAQQSSSNSVYQNTNTVNCKKMGEFLNVEIKTFSGTICPIGWIQAY